MCGIAGIVSEHPMPASNIKRMTDCLRHRGPDDEGFLVADSVRGTVQQLTGADSQVDGTRVEDYALSANLSLGHRRLSIIDPTPTGHQPMSGSDDTLWIVFNGEIYNYIELRKELRGLGYVFRTPSDTEVILAAYDVWGEDCVYRFNGMWAFVIYDRRRNVLFGSRDRFGVKPLYYTFSNGVFVFASEIKAILTLNCIEKCVNSKAVFDYLAMGLEEQEPEGFFKGVFELSPSHNFRFDLNEGGCRTWSYYQLAFNAVWEPFNSELAIMHSAHIRELIMNAVSLRLRSDVTVGSCLSGGIDSSSIVCVINELLKREKLTQLGGHQKVFTASYSDSPVDESDWARIVVDKTDADWHRTYPVAEELLSDLTDLVHAQEVPFGSTSIYAQYRVMRLARDSGVKVVLDGQGGDELFSGYHHYYRMYFAEMIGKGEFSTFFAELSQMNNAPIGGRGMFLGLLKLYALKHLPGSISRLLIKHMTHENRYISRDFWLVHQERLDNAGDRIPASLNEMLWHYMTCRNLKTLLRYEDRNSMRFSIESRTPFADDVDLIEGVFRIPSSYKIHNGWSKYLLRESMTGILPDKIRYRTDKVGFATPEYSWLNAASRDLRELCSGKALEEFIDVKSFFADWDYLLNNQAKTGITAVWRLINLSIWLNIYHSR